LRIVNWARKCYVRWRHWLVGGFICGVRDLKHARVHLLQRINALLQLDIVRRELGLFSGILTTCPTWS
jgi:hypothetical protein